PIALGTAVLFHGWKELMSFYDEIVARATDLPSFTIPETWNYGKTLNQQFLLYLASIAADTRCEIQWEVTGGISLGSLLQFGKKDDKGCLLSIYNNGLPLFSARYALRSRHANAKAKGRLLKSEGILDGSNQLTRIKAHASFFQDNDAVVLLDQDRKHGFNVASANIIVDTAEITISATNMERLAPITRRLLDGETIDLDAVNALAGIDIDISSSDLGLLAELHATSPETSYQEISADAAKEISNGLITWQVADFHSHTAASDGVFRPQDMAVFAACAGIDVYGLSDHHSIAPSAFLARYAKDKRWKMAIIPGCQEVTHIYFHAVSLGASASVIESVPVEQVPAEARKVGAFLNFSHSRLPHPWPKEQMRLGKASAFDSFDLSDRIIQEHWAAWVNKNGIPVLTESTGTDTGDFGRRSRTIFFVPGVHSLSSTFFEGLPSHFIEDLKNNECVALSGSVLAGKVKNVARVQAILSATRGPIKDRYEHKKFEKFLSLLNT
nr:hypothetical protein [Candidatus Sigynarchaeota archaeon]